MEKKSKNLNALMIVGIASIVIGILLLSGCIENIGDRQLQISKVVTCSNITSTNFALAQPNLNTTSNTFYENSPIYVCANITTSMGGSVVRVRILNLSNSTGENLSDVPVITSLNWEENYEINGEWRCLNLSNKLQAGKYNVRVILGEKENQVVDVLLEILNYSSEKFCSADYDCACGIHIKTGACFYGNKNFVDTTEQCPDFCTGIANIFEIKCIDEECKQINKLSDNSSSNNSSSKPTQIPTPIATNVVEANNRFAFELYSKYKDNEGNIFFSPYSISTALAMTYEGARGKTAEEMQNVLHLSDNKEKIHSDFVVLNKELNKANKSYNLSVANALWAQKDYKFLEEYFKIIERYYGGKVTNLDFIEETEKSRQIINNWIENKTNNKIKNLIPEGVLDDMTRLVLTNAVYFKANWSIQFDAKDTYDQKFKLGSNKTTTAKMMHKTAYFNYGETNEIQILEMDYLGNDLSMVVILPKEGHDIGDIGRTISAEKFNKWKSNMKYEMVAVAFPKFKYETKYFMRKTLSDMGMSTAFSENADFSGMTGEKNLFISEVIHQTFVEVAEYGTEAAAATAVVVKATAAPGKIEQPKVFNADHPFIFIIQDKKTGNILFLGMVNNPNKNY